MSISNDGWHQKREKTGPFMMENEKLESFKVRLIERMITNNVNPNNGPYPSPLLNLVMSLGLDMS